MPPKSRQSSVNVWLIVIGPILGSVPERFFAPLQRVLPGQVEAMQESAPLENHWRSTLFPETTDIGPGEYEPLFAGLPKRVALNPPPPGGETTKLVAHAVQ